VKKSTWVFCASSLSTLNPAGHLLDVIGSSAIRRLDRFAVFSCLVVRVPAVLADFGDDGVIGAEIDSCPKCFPQAFAVRRIRLEHGHDQLVVGALDRVIAVVSVTCADPSSQQAKHLVRYVAHQRIEKPLVALRPDPLDRGNYVFGAKAAKAIASRDLAPCVKVGI